MQTYNATDVDLVLEWVDKYFEVNVLINKVFGGENFENHSSMPSFEDEIEYQRLRFWFRKHHDKFVPIWFDFCLSRGTSIEFTDNIDEMKYRENPFLYYYYPDDLLDLAYTMGATTTTDTWNPNKQAVELILNIINKFCCTVIQFVHWIGEFADISGQYPYAQG
jgi:hypothetical protein